MKGGDNPMLKLGGGDIIDTGLCVTLKQLMTLLEEITVLRNELELKNRQLSKIAKLIQEYERGIK